MRKIRFGIGGILMLAAMLVSDSAAVLAVYALAAIIHELGHFLAAKALKIKIKEVTFGFSGIRIMTDERLTSYKQEIFLASAGPLANLFVAVAVLTCAHAAKIDSETIFEAAEAFLNGDFEYKLGILGFLALSSIIQAIINLLPVNSFDGGRIIYCAIARLNDQRTAEQLLSVLSAFSAFILWTAALYVMLRIGAGLGIYVFAACIFLSGLKEENKQ